MALRCKIVDAETGRDITINKAVLRYIGYFVSILPLGLGLLWVGFDSKKRGWHDYIAGTVVVHNTQEEPVRFNAPRSTEDLRKNSLL